MPWVRGIIHDLRQPLTALTMNLFAAARMLETDPVPGEAMRAILADAAAEANLVEQELQLLASLFRPAGSPESRGRRIVLHDVVDEVGRVLRSTARAYGVHLDLSARTDVTIAADADLVRAALVIIMLDAIASCAPVGNEKRVTLRCVRERHRFATMKLSYACRTDPPSNGWRLAMFANVVAAYGARTTVAVDGAREVVVDVRWPAQ